MTNKPEPSSSDDKYKQIYYRRNRLKPYTTARVCHDDYLQTDVWRELRNARLKMDNYQCQKCGTAVNVAVHHINYPEYWGMENVATDLVTLCARCHAEVHKNDIAQKKEID